MILVRKDEVFTKNSSGDKLFKVRERCNQKIKTGGPLRELKKIGEKGVEYFWKAMNSTSVEKIVWIGGFMLSVKGIEKSSIQLQERLVIFLSCDCGSDCLQLFV